MSIGNMLSRHLVQKESGLPTLVHEGNQADKREGNEAEVFDRVQTFLERSMGMEKLVEQDGLISARKKM